MAFPALLPLLLITQAAAQGSTPDAPEDPTCTGGRAQAEARVLRSYRLRENDQLPEALADLECAARLDPVPRNLALLGLAHHTAKEWVSAELSLEAGLVVSEDPWISANQAMLKAALREIKTHVGELTFGEAPPQARVVVDGRGVGRLPLAAPLRVAAGPHEVEVLADGCTPFRTSVVLRGATSNVVAVSLQCQAPVGPKWPPRRIAGWTAAVLAAGGLGFGVYQHVQRERHADDFNTPGNGCGGQVEMRGEPGCEAIHKQVTGAQTRALVGYLSGVAAAGLATYLLWPTASTERAWACSPLPGGLTCGAVF